MHEARNAHARQPRGGEGGPVGGRHALRRQRAGIGSKGTGETVILKMELQDMLCCVNRLRRGDGIPGQGEGIATERSGGGHFVVQCATVSVLG